MPRRSFKRGPEGTIKVNLPAEELSVLASVAEDVAEALNDGLPDEVRQRLFPAAYDDAVKEAEFRRLMAGDLEERKAADLATFRASLLRGPPLVLDGDEARAWLGALQDMRLALGTMLGIEQDGWEADDTDDPQMALLHYLGFVQDGLIRLVM